MNKNQEDYVAIIVPALKMKLCKDKYVESIKGGQNICVSRGNREQKDAKMGVHQGSIPIVD
jgi:hypothetical protein